ncbi:hypothetical protein B0H11DRAFT_1710512 [Mycena galericulata]|nr:hypothetical protein B0H11DRAFT_1710512 [Mycena galericulata]
MYHIFRRRIAFVEAHRDATRPVVGKVFAIEEARAAYEYLASQGHVRKDVIRVE